MCLSLLLVGTGKRHAPVVADSLADSTTIHGPEPYLQKRENIGNYL